MEESHNESRKPAFIRMGNGGKIDAVGNIVIGNADFIQADGTLEARLKDNTHIIPADENSRAWYTKPFAKGIGSIISAVVGGGLIYLFGWN